MLTDTYKRLARVVCYCVFICLYTFMRVCVSVCMYVHIAVFKNNAYNRFSLIL